MNTLIPWKVYDPIKPPPLNVTHLVSDGDDIGSAVLMLDDDGLHWYQADSCNFGSEHITHFAILNRPVDKIEHNLIPNDTRDLINMILRSADNYQDHHVRIAQWGELQRIRAEAAEEERDKLEVESRMTARAFEKFKEAVELLNFQLEGYGLYKDDNTIVTKANEVTSCSQQK